MEEKRKEQLRALERLKELERMKDDRVKLEQKKVKELNQSQFTPSNWSSVSTNLHTPDLEFNPNKVGIINFD